MDRLRSLWDEKAAADAMGASCPERREWTAESFLASGQAFINARVAANLPAWSAAVGTPVGQFRVLDLGCGAGRLLRALHGTCGEVHAVDVSPKMLAIAREAAGGLDHIRFALSDGLSLQCVNRQTYHLALCIDVLGHQPADAFVRYLLGQVQDKLVAAGTLLADLPASWAGPRIDAVLAMLDLTRARAEIEADRLWLQLQKSPVS